LDGAAIAAKMEGWKPGTPIERVIDPIAATIAKFGKMDPAAQAALLAQLQALKA